MTCRQGNKEQEDKKKRWQADKNTRAHKEKWTRRQGYKWQREKVLGDRIQRTKRKDD